MGLFTKHKNHTRTWFSLGKWYTCLRIYKVTPKTVLESLKKNVPCKIAQNIHCIRYYKWFVYDGTIRESFHEFFFKYLILSFCFIKRNLSVFFDIHDHIIIQKWTKIIISENLSRRMRYNPIFDLRKNYRKWQKDFMSLI